MSGVSFDDIFLLRVRTGRLPGSAAGLCGLGEPGSVVESAAPQDCHRLTVCLWTGHCSSLALSLSICKMGIITVPTLLVIVRMTKSSN